MFSLESYRVALTFLGVWLCWLPISARADAAGASPDQRLRAGAAATLDALRRAALEVGPNDDQRKRIDELFTAHHARLDAVAGQLRDGKSSSRPRPCGSCGA